MKAQTRRQKGKLCYIMLKYKLNNPFILVLGLPWRKKDLNQ
jgi:hypothetical protein